MDLLQSAQLNVQVQGGIVTIAGRVNTFAQRKAVERAARRVAGIRTLILEIGASVTPLVGRGERASSTKKVKSEGQPSGGAASLNIPEVRGHLPF
jgi:hypothetical protein